MTFECHRARIHSVYTNVLVYARACVSACEIKIR